MLTIDEVTAAIDALTWQDDGEEGFGDLLNAEDEILAAWERQVEEMAREEARRAMQLHRAAALRLSALEVATTALHPKLRADAAELAERTDLPDLPEDELRRLQRTMAAVERRVARRAV